MANRDTPFGLRTVFHLTGGVIRPQKYLLDGGNATAIYTGDWVARADTGRFIEVPDTTGVLDVDVDEGLGAFAGISYRDSDGNMIFRKSWVASTATLGDEDATAYVYDDPFIVYRVQFDTAVPATDIGIVSDLTYVAGSHTTGQSATTGVAGTTGNAIYTYDHDRNEDNEINAANNKVLVLLNLHAYRNGGAASYALGD